jgi:Tfp pilus assembly protein PilX
MKMLSQNDAREQGAATIFYLMLMVVIMSVLGSVLLYVANSARIEHRRSDMSAARQFAEGGAVIGCDEVNSAFTTTSGTMASALTTKGYTLNSTLSNSQWNVYQRTITTPFVNQSVLAQLWIPTGTSPKSAKIVATATKNGVTQTATVGLTFTWGYPAAIISTNAGSNDTGYSKSAGQAGNVALNGATGKPLIVDGNVAKAILANGHANIDPAIATIPASSVSAGNFGSSNEIPDYTAQGTDNSLFDFARFTAAADATLNPLNTVNGTNHFTSLAAFMKANAAAAATPAGALEGVIVVDISKTDAGIDVLANPEKYIGTSYMPAVNPQKKGITVRGSLFFNFGSAYGPLDKIFNRTPMNINPADLTSFVATNPSTYTSGYPPVYSDSTKNPVNVDISSKGFQNFTADEDLPAVMYSIGTLDMHGPANISGVMYTPSYSEIENRPNEGFAVANQLQYYKGSIIVGMGVYIENVNTSSTVVSFDQRTVDSLATMGGAGKKVKVAYWQ